MGLDAVEIVMEVEDAFDICIEDTDAEKILTPRSLIEVVQAKVATVEPSVCLNQRAFNFLRRYLLERCALPRKSIAPKAKLSALIPRARRKSFLQQLASDINAGSPPPPLARPVWLKRSLAAFSIAVGVFVGLTFGADTENVFVLLLFAAGTTAWVAVLATRPFRTEFQFGLETVGDLAIWVRRHKADFANCSQKAWTREQIATRVREIVVAQLGCAKTYNEDARFIEDLGLS